MAWSILLKFLTLKCGISRTIWRTEVSGGSFSCIFHALLFQLNLFFWPDLPFKIGENQSKIGWKFAKQWLQKAKVSGTADDGRPDLFEKCTNLKQPYCFSIIFFRADNHVSISNKHTHKTFTKGHWSWKHCQFTLMHLLQLCYIASKTFWLIPLGNAVILWQWLLWVSPSQLAFVQYVLSKIFITTA